MQTPIDFSTLTSSQKDALIVQLLERVDALTQQVQELQAQLKLNSRNSSKPPSSDGYDKPKPKSTRTKSGKPSGGQPGHPGKTLKKTAHPDYIVNHAPEACTNCGLDLSAAPVLGFEARQVFDLPLIKIEATEHRAQIKACSCCQSRNKALFPEHVNQPVQYGTEVQCVVTYLSQYQMLPYARLKEAMADLFQVHLSEGTVNNILRRAYQHLEVFDIGVRAMIIDSKVAHFDESGLRVGKQLQWLHVAATEHATYYRRHVKRGYEAMMEMGILEGFKGYAVHDCWASYFRFAILHVLCGAHFLRELIHAHEQHQQRWAEKLITCLLDAKKEADEARANGALMLEASRISHYDRRYSRILREGRAELPEVPIPITKKRGRAKQHKVKNLHDRLFRYKAETLAFIYDLTLPFDNNLAERDVRMIKAKLKISGCFRSEQGADIFCRIRGYISTAKKQGRNVLDSLRDSFQGQPFNPAIASVA